MTHI